MRLFFAFLIASFFLLAIPPSARSQGEAALPFLLLSPSPEANGMAGISVAVHRADPLSAVFSPAQVGLTSLSTGASGAFYAAETDWFPQFQIAGLTYSAWAMQGGVRLNDFISLPLRLGIGLAYHQVDFDLGTFVVTNSSGQVIDRFNSSENANGLTLGVGLEYIVEAGFGYTFRSISSRLSGIGTEAEKGTGEADVAAKDYAGYLMLPLVQLVEAAAGPIESGDGFRPFADLSLGFAFNNIGDKVVYLDAAQADPLPRTSRAGVGITAGVRLNDWELGGLTWSREAEDLLVIREGVTWEYQSGFGDLEFGNNVIAGNASGNVGLRTGWQLQLGEFFTYREGTFRQSNINYETSGMTFQLAGILKGTALAVGNDAPSWLLFARDHFDLQYHQAKYVGGNPDDAKFEALSMHVRLTPH